jgi:hypothetical protein
VFRARGVRRVRARVVAQPALGARRRVARGGPRSDDPADRGRGGGSAGVGSDGCRPPGGRGDRGHPLVRAGAPRVAVDDRRRRRRPIVVLCTARPRALRRRRGVGRRPFQHDPPFGAADGPRDDDARQSLLRASITHRDRARLDYATSGQPLFAVEFVRMLVSGAHRGRGADVGAGRDRRAPGLVSPELRTMLQDAAVVGAGSGPTPPRDRRRRAPGTRRPGRALPAWVDRAVVRLVVPRSGGVRVRPR